MKKILVVEDDSEMNESIVEILQAAGFEAEGILDGGAAMAKFTAMHPDLVLLDVQLPGLNGLEIAGKIRQNHGTPIIMLTARTDTEDIVKGLEAGADDYVPKPFDSAVLIARINARLRDTKPAGAEVITLGPITIDVPGHEVRKDGIRLQLTPLEFNLLQTLAASPGEVFSREELLVKVWGYQFKPDDKFKPDTRLVNVHVQRLRSKIEEDADSPHFVLTERGIGYKAGSN
jgi:two-component system response regulator MtrA